MIATTKYEMPYFQRVKVQKTKLCVSIDFLKFLMNWMMRNTTIYSRHIFIIRGVQEDMQILGSIQKRTQKRMYMMYVQLLML